MKRKTFFLVIFLILFILAGCKSATDQMAKANLSEIQARKIAEETCIKGGESLAPGIYNENTRTWWFDANLNSIKEGCNPACVVSEDSMAAEINWRCTGLNIGNDPTVCSEGQRNAEVCMQIYEPVCATVQIQCIKAPCNPIEQTYTNACEACSNSLVSSYIVGECADNNQKECPESCPLYAPPAPGWCANGDVLPPLKDACGCDGPPRCSVAAKEIKSLMVAKYTKYASTLSVNISNETESHVRGTVIFEPGAPGIIFLATKIDNVWKIVHEGNGEIPCSLSQYGFPENMILDCAVRD